MHASVGIATYLLLVSAVLLALLNTFVMKAVAQHARERDLPKIVSVLYLEFPSDVGEDEDDNSVEFISSIRPVPVLFTDTFRWLLVRVNRPEANDGTTGCPSSSLAQEQSNMSGTRNQERE